MLALAGRSEVRDFVDTIYLNNNQLALGVLIWAAYGKDPGYTPELLLTQCQRHSRYTQGDLDRLMLAISLDIRELKQEWLKAVEDAGKLISSLPYKELGCLYLDADDKIVTPDPFANEFSTLKRHRGSLGGAWPTIEVLG